VSGGDELAALLELARRDERIVGLFLSGSRGKAAALAGPGSDYDVRVILADEDQELRARLSTERGGRIEAWVATLPELEGYAEPGSDSAWDRYSFTHVRVLVDKREGLVQRLVDRKGRLGEEEAMPVVREALDAYVNLLYRSLKDDRAGRGQAARLDAAESVPYLLTFLFALEGRVRPFNAYLEWELAAHPLTPELARPDRLLDRLGRVLGGRRDDQQHLFREVEELARERGHGDVVDAWQPDVAFLRGDA
jgi:hypothetical protein